MSPAELKVLLISAAAFLVINIIMWSVIAVKEKHSGDSGDPPAANDLSFSSFSRPNYDNGDLPTVHLSETDNFAAPTERVVRDDFHIVDNIVMTHTDEII